MTKEVVNYGSGSSQTFEETNCTNFKYNIHLHLHYNIDTLIKKYKSKYLSFHRPVYDTLEAGTIVPGFNLSLINGGRIDLKNIGGKITILNFWYEKNVNCIESISMLDTIYAEYHNRGVNIVSINVGDNADSIKDFVKYVAFPVALSDLSLARQYNIQTYPTILVIDAQKHSVLTEFVKYWGAPMQLYMLRDYLDYYLK